jgi:hypothetical protein
MSLFKQLTRLSVTAMDVAQAREFYSDTLGLEEIPRPAFNFPGIWYSLEAGRRYVLLVRELGCEIPVDDYLQ